MLIKRCASLICAATWVGLSASALAVEPSEPPSELQQLQWMVGSWVHDSEGVVVKMEGQWSENRRFLQRVFVLKLGNVAPLKVRQTLYWDPVEKELRSWGFASDGSFESGVWEVDGKRVHNTRSITYPDGTRGSAVNTWELADPKQCVLTSAKRRKDGKRLPDIAPTEMERK